MYLILNADRKDSMSDLEEKAIDIASNLNVTVKVTAAENPFLNFVITAEDAKSIVLAAWEADFRAQFTTAARRVAIRNESWLRGKLIGRSSRPQN
jgi:arginyl-tRNA synthetase